MNSAPLWATKNTIFLCTTVDRATRCILAWAVTSERTFDVMQDVVDQTYSLRPACYFSDGLNVYPMLLYPSGTHRVAPGKSQTYSVEAVNADLRHYLARLG